MLFFRWLWFMRFWQFLVYFVFIPSLVWVVFRIGYHYGSNRTIGMHDIFRNPRGYFLSCAPPIRSQLPVLPYFAIWMGTYRTKTLATAQKNELTKKRINATVFRQNAFYFVIVGKYGTLETALNQLQLLKDKGYLYARIVKPYSL